MGMEDEAYFLAALLQVAGIGRQRALALIAAFGSARAVWQADRGDLFLSKLLSETVLDALMAARKVGRAEQLADRCQQVRVGVVAVGDTQYPALLAETPDAPLVLYYRGAALPALSQAVAIVGTRRASPYGIAVAKDMAACFAERGLAVVSGGAAGIDGAAHEGALSANGVTAAVLGCGVDICYPPKHKFLFERIAASGVLLSEYPPGTTPSPGQFPARNRIISGLCRGVVVVEAGQKSGALITADLALDYNRDVFCVPGSIFSPVSQGTHALIKQGAQLIEHPDEVLLELGLENGPANNEKTVVAASDDEKAVLNCCCVERPATGEAILDQTGLTPAAAAQSLLTLEIKGLIRRSENGYWRLKGR